MAEDVKPIPATHNGYDPVTVKSAVSRVDNVMDELESEKGAYMARCKRLREDIKHILDEAKDQGIPKKELKAIIKARELERKAEDCRADLDPDQQDTYDALRHALGDLEGTPLGDAALSKTSNGQSEARA